MPTFEFSGEIAGAPKEDLFDNLGAKIKVVGVGGAGGNAVNSMINDKIDGVEFIAVNSDFQDLQKSQAKRVIQIGKKYILILGIHQVMSSKKPMKSVIIKLVECRVKQRKRG